MRVINISEKGVLFAGGKIEADLEQVIRARIFFVDCPPLDVKGSVVRIEEDGIAVQLIEGVPMYQMIQEQQRLKKKYMDAQ